MSKTDNTKKDVLEQINDWMYTDMMHVDSIGSICKHEITINGKKVCVLEGDECTGHDEGCFEDTEE